MIGPLPAHELVQAAEARRSARGRDPGTGGTCCRGPCRSRAPATSAGSRPLTVAFVASGTKAGVRTSPCAVRRTPARAREPGSRAVIVQDTGECGHRGMVEALWCWPASCPSPGTWAIRCCSSSSRSRRWGSRSRRDRALHRRRPRVGRPSEDRLRDRGLGRRGDRRRQRRVRARAALRTRGCPSFPGPLERHRRRVIEVGEPFFERHGAKAVFLGRWVTGLRITSAWLAGVNRMGVADVPLLERARRDLLGDIDRAPWRTSSGAARSAS